MIERKSEIKQGAVAAVLSVAALAGSLYINDALDYRTTFIPGTVINGEEAAGLTVSEMEEFGGYYHKGPDFKPGEPNMRREFRKLDGTIDHPFEPKVNFSFKKLFGLIKLKKQMKKRSVRGHSGG